MVALPLVRTSVCCCFLNDVRAELCETESQHCSDLRVPKDAEWFLGICWSFVFPLDDCHLFKPLAHLLLNNLGLGLVYVCYLSFLFFIDAR